MSKYDCNIRPYGQDLFIKKNTLYGQIWMTAVKICLDVSGRNYSILIFGRLVIFGCSVLYLFGRLVKNSAVRFLIRPSGQ